MKVRITYARSKVIHGNMWISQHFSHKKIENCHAPFLYHLGNSTDEESIKLGGIVPGEFDECTQRIAWYFSLVSALDKNRDQKYKPHNRLQRHHDIIYVIDMQAVTCYFPSRPSFLRRSSTSKMDAKVLSTTELKNEIRLHRRKVDANIASQRNPREVN